jgi:hypothetical protein
LQKVRKFCSHTGAHFDFNDMCAKLNKLAAERLSDAVCLRLNQNTFS